MKDLAIYILGYIIAYFMHRSQVDIKQCVESNTPITNKCILWRIGFSLLSWAWVIFILVIMMFESKWYKAFGTTCNAWLNKPFGTTCNAWLNKPIRTCNKEE